MSAIPKPESSRALHLTHRDRTGLLWLRQRCAAWQFTLKRRRKYAIPKGVPFTLEEADTLRCLLELERAVDGLLNRYFGGCAEISQTGKVTPCSTPKKTLG